MRKSTERLIKNQNENHRVIWQPVRYIMKSRNHHWNDAEQSIRPFEWILHVSPDKSQTNFQDPQLICNRGICLEVLLPDSLPQCHSTSMSRFTSPAVLSSFKSVSSNYSSCVFLWHILTLVITNSMRCR